MHVCLFDIDGTLLNSGGAGQAAMEAAIVSEFGALERYEGLSTAGRTDRAIMTDLFTYHKVAHDEHAFSRFIAAYLKHLPQQLAARQGMVLPGVAALLDTLAAREDVLLGLLTGNYREGAKLKLGHHRLYDYCQFGGFGDHHQHRDDVAREAFAEVRERLNGSVVAEKVWVIGDTPADVRCARAIGVNAVAVATGMYSATELESTNPDYLFADFSNPEPLLTLLE
jgi:phosphoglycolate phosphatase-like HAD superfamily hydrolase